MNDGSTPTALVARVHALGSPDQVRLDPVPVPSPRPGELLIAVHAAGVNYPDVLMIGGSYQTRTPLPFVPGHEAAGVVAGIGDGVSGWSVGDRVAVLAPGAFAEFLVAPAQAAHPIPASVSVIDAAATWVCHLTAYHALRSVAEVSAGETVLVLGAGGGLGLAAVELAAIRGATVIAAASDPRKLAAARARGARYVVDYSEGDLRRHLRDIVGASAVDVVLDPVGGSVSEDALRELRWGGRFVTLGYASGDIPRIPLNVVMLKGVTVKGLEVRTFAAHDPEAAERDRREFTELWEAGRIRPFVDATFPLSHVRDALQHVAGRRSVGKTVVLIRDDAGRGM
ncbi:NADPH:quinone oxidoreductase family protein [Nocardioides panacihumi]|uniref:NADPH:quinone oxidoreductase family protein n=1 Tax=Nocardioides panacihumi TaxID=400774 RepID=A0ABP5D0K1_9ACTN